MSSAADFLSENKSFCTLDNGYRMAYVKAGPSEGTSDYTMIFMHGNPTSSYLYRNIMPSFSDQYNTLAFDLIGMGDSDKLNATGDGTYTYAVHSDFVDQFLENCVDIGDNVVLVLHDWGSGLGFDWARRNADKVKGIAYFEALVKPLTTDTVDQSLVDFFTFFYSDEGEAAILQQNFFVEDILPSLILRNLTEEEMDAYRAPYLEAGESRRPLIDWPRQVPLDGLPEDTTQIVTNYGEWLSTSDDLPKLLIVADPGSLLNGDMLAFARSWPNQTELSVPGLHFLQEDSPELIVQAIDEWMEASVVVSSTDPGTSPATRADAVSGGFLLASFFVFRACKWIF